MVQVRIDKIRKSQLIQCLWNAGLPSVKTFADPVAYKKYKEDDCWDWAKYYVDGTPYCPKHARMVIEMAYPEDPGQLNKIVGIINNLRVKGLLSYATELDQFLRRNAQELGAPGADPLATLEGGEAEMGGVPPPAEAAPLPTPEQVPETPEKDEMLYTLYYQFEKWHSILDRELPKFDYFGKQNIAALRSALVNVHKAFQIAIQNKPKKFSKPLMDRWNREVDQLVQRMHESQKAKLDPTKAIVDANMLYDTTDRLNESCKRLCGGDSVFTSVIQEFDNLVHVFANVVKSTSEQVAGQDLTKVR